MPRPISSPPTTPGSCRWSRKTGPDGCLYILDWYDRYHCYQDAGRDPQGIDRLKGRLYRVRYKDSPRAAPFDMARESDDRLIERLHSENVYFRDIAQRLLWERNNAATRTKLEALVLDAAAPRKARMHALWALLGCGPLDAEFHQKLLAHDDVGFRAWAVRAAGNAHRVSPVVRDAVAKMATDSAPDVRLQVAIAASKIEGLDAVSLLVNVLSASDGDPLIPHIVWQNLHPLLEAHAADFVSAAMRTDRAKSAHVAALFPRAVERLAARETTDFTSLATLVEALVAGDRSDTARAAECLSMLAAKVQSRELRGEKLAALRSALVPVLAKVRAGGNDGPLHLDVALLLTSWGDPTGPATARDVLMSAKQPEARRLQAVDALVAAGHAEVIDDVSRLSASPDAASMELRRRMLASLARLDRPRVAEVVLAAFGRLEPELKPQAIELLTGRAAWSKARYWPRSPGTRSTPRRST